MNNNITFVPASLHSPQPVISAPGALLSLCLHDLAHIKNDARATLSKMASPSDEQEQWFDALSFPECQSDESGELWFDALETLQASPVSLRDDVIIMLRQLISRFAAVKESEFILRGLLRAFPWLPVDLLVTTRSVFNAVINGTGVDLALLDSLAAASHWVLADGNALAQMALSLKNTLAASLGLGAEEQGSNPYDTLLTALAAVAIVARYCWRNDGQLPVRRYLHLPLFVSDMLLRAGQYWGRLGRIALRANATCTMQAGSARYDCVRDETLRQRTGQALWDCQQVNAPSPSLANCPVNLSEAALAQLQTDGYLRTRIDSTAEEPDEATACGVASHSTFEMTPLVMPLAIAAAQVQSASGVESWSTASKIAGAAGVTLLATAAGGAVYWLTGGGQAGGDAYTDIPSSDGRLTATEIRLLDEVITPLFSDASFSAPASIPLPLPLTAQERSSLSDALNSIRRSLQSPATPAFVRARRSLTPVSTIAPDDRTLYWRAKLAQTPPGSAEQVPLRDLAKLNEGKITAVAIPKESIPGQDGWYTGMDRFDYSAFTDPWFFDNIQHIALEVAHSTVADYPDGTLAQDKWMHSDLFWQAFYLQILVRWGDAILEADAAVARDYHAALKQVGEHVLRLKTFGRTSVNLPLFSPEGFALLQVTIASMEHAHSKLLTFSDRQQSQLLGALKDKLWLTGQDQTPGNQTAVGDYRYIDIVDHLESINLSAFTDPFIPELLQLLNSLVVLQNSTITQAEHFGQARFYMELSLLSLKRLLDAEQADEVERAYNYATLEEQVAEILSEDIDQQAERYHIARYQKIYQPYRETAWQAWKAMQERLASSPVVSTPASSTDVTPTTEESAQFVANVSRAQITEYIARHADVRLPEVRQSIEDAMAVRFAKRAGEFIQHFMAFAHDDIMRPALYLDRWIENTLRAHHLQHELSPASTIKVFFYKHEYKTGITYETCEQYFTLRDIVRGQHLHTSFDSYKVAWPDSVSNTLQETLRDSIDESIKRKIERHFANADLPDLYRVMAQRAALAYLQRKITSLSEIKEQRDNEQNAFIDNVKAFLEGKVQPQFLAWHGETLPGILFIPCADGMKKNAGRGVLFSLWDSDYYEIPAPGLAVSQIISALNHRPLSSLRIEQDEKLRAFITRHNVPRTAEAAGKVSDPFGWHTILLPRGGSVGIAEGNKIEYRAPLQIIDTDDYIRAQIALQKSDLITLYDNFIITRSEHIRAQVHEMCNSLSMTVGGMLMMFGGLPGIPLAAAVGASVLATLLLDVVPNTVLYSLADDEEERQLYLDTIVLAAAMEGLGSLPLLGKFPASSALWRVLMQRGSYALTTLTSGAEDMLRQAIKRLSVERLRPVVERVPIIRNVVQEELDEIIKHVGISASEPAQTGRAERGSSSSVHLPDPLPGLQISASGAAAQGFFKAEKIIWQSLHEKLWNKHFSVGYRALLTWHHANSDVVNIEFLTLARKHNDIVVISRLTEGSNHAFIVSSETEWAHRIYDAAAKGNTLVKYIDFADTKAFAAQHNHLAAVSARQAKDEYIKGATTLFATEAYRNAIKKRTGIGYDDIQRVLAQREKIKRWKKEVKITSSENAVITEPVRHLPTEALSTATITDDFDAAGLLATFTKNNKLKEYYQNNIPLLNPLKTMLERNGFTNIRWRNVLLWERENSVPFSHYLVIATNKDVDYAFDVTAAHLKKNIKQLAELLIIRESDWVLRYAKGGEGKLIKYQDFDAAISPHSFQVKVSTAPTEALEGGVILAMPRWFLAMKKAIVEKQVALLATPPSLSQRLLQHMESGEISVKEFTLLDEPKLEDFLIRRRVSTITNPGPDINVFRPVPDLEGIRKSTKHLTSAYTLAITSSQDFKVVGDNLSAMLVQKNLSYENLRALSIFKNAFISAFDIMSKMKVLMQLAVEDVNVKTRILGRLAIFLNDDNINILAESYQRLAFITEQTWQTAHYHVITKKLKRIIPVNAIEKADRATMLACTFSEDPLKRILVFLNNCHYFNMKGVALHEITHQAFRSLDVHYLYPKLTNELHHRPILSIQEAHNAYGRRLPYESALKFALGRMDAINRDIYELPLSEHEKLIAIARMQKLPMLKANLKMNNADSVVVLFNDLTTNIETATNAAGRPVITGTRVRRSLPTQDAQGEVEKLLQEEILATLLAQIGLSGNNAVALDKRQTNPGS